MSMIFFTYRSRTQARMGAARLKQAGIPWRLEKTPAGLTTRGCGYGLRVPANRGPEAAGILRQTPYEKSYLIDGRENREVRL